MGYRGWLLSSAMGSILGLVSGGAQAQNVDTAPQAAAAVDEVVVTGQRFGSGLSRATFSLGREDLDDRPLGAEITQSLQKIPGVQVSTGDSRGGSFSYEIALRGLSDEQIGLTIDGIPTGDSRFNGGSPPMRFIEPSNIGRIDVSQSSGDIGAPSRFALGGFIDFVTDDPAATPGASFEGGIGSFDFRRASVRLDSGEVADGLSAYVSASSQDYDVWAGEDSRSASRDHYEVKAVKRFANGSRVQARVAYNDQTDNDFNVVTLQEFEADPDTDRATDAISGIPSRDVDYGGALGGTREDLLAYVNIDLALSPSATLSLNPYYQTLDGESFRYQDRARDLTGSDPRAVTGYNANGGAVRPVLVTARNSNVVGGPADMRVTPRDRERYGVTGEFRVEDLFAGHTLRVGGWWEGGDSTERRNFYRITDSATSIAYDRAALNYVEYERSAEVETTMLYVQDAMVFLDGRLKIDAGLTWFDIDYAARSPLEYRAEVAFSQPSDVNPKLGAVYSLSDAWEVFGGYAQNFAGIPEDAFLGSTAVINPGDLEPVETENFDLGLRFVRDTMALSIQAYSVDLANNVGIVPRDPAAPVDPDEVVRGNVATRAANTAGITTRGIELTGFTDLGSVSLYGSYAYQDAKHDDPAVGSRARLDLASVGVIGGARVRDIPEHSAYGEINWTPLPRLKLQASARYIGDRVGGHILRSGTFEEVAVDELEAYTLVGLSGQYDLDCGGLCQDVRLQLNVDNLFDEDYIASVSSATATQPEFGLTAGSTTGRTLDRYFIGAPRTVTLSLRARF
ncbi:TonB-dependent receptor [Brevundimonas sp. LM2]|uniref:TonB-dependent receptor n=1 Tax=Brevundimonas sp. LM2 TaxID=1938605 RepID=UPI0009839E69|nr:TonB-dependent receptor [Brevundimonas sp. LM2]AQR62666.1 TonB-dependent receptor [Brevundimonas sp. LM2]